MTAAAPPSLATKAWWWRFVDAAGARWFKRRWRRFVCLVRSAAVTASGVNEEDDGEKMEVL